jgi:feruloyl-CoA synthase
VRTDVLRALAPYVAELVVCGDGQTYVAVLAWPNRAAIERDFGIPAQGRPDVAAWAPLRAALAERLATHNRENPTASTRALRCLLLEEPPQSAANELSDKGTINRNAVLSRRAADLARLYADVPGDEVVIAGH